MNILNTNDPWMQLPTDFIIPERVPKRQPGPVDFSVFDEDQMTVVEKIMEYIEGKSEFAMMSLEGFAGVGKTFVTSHILEWLSYAKKMDIAFTAPTNKAVDVAKTMSEVEARNITFSTLHKLLALKETYDHYGRLQFFPDNNESPAIANKEILIIDESSMLDHKLFEYVYEHVKNNGLKVIFVGDPLQIPPINRLESIPYMSSMRRKYGIGVQTLTKIRRQAAENPILRFATCIRENIDQHILPFDYTTQLHGNSGVVVLKKTEKDIIYHICDTYFSNDYFTNYSDFAKINAYRNVTVNAINDKVRKLIFKKQTLPKLMEGEKLLADEPIKDGGYVVFSTNAEFEVKGYEVRTTIVQAIVDDVLIFKQSVKYYDTVVIGTQQSDKKNFMKERTIRIIHEDSEKEFAQSLEIAKIAILKLDPKTRSWNWKAFYGAKETFAWVKYNYAITVHKSQGSTYQNSMMLEWDIDTIMRPEKIVERNRIKYVAVTRAKQYLFIVK